MTKFNCYSCDSSAGSDSSDSSEESYINDKKKCHKTQKVKLWQNFKTQIGTKLKNSIWDKTQKHKLLHYSKS